MLNGLRFMSKLSAYDVVELVHLIKRDKRINQIQLFESRYLAEAYLNKRYKELYGIMELGCGVLSFSYIMEDLIWLIWMGINMKQF